MNRFGEHGRRKQRSGGKHRASVYNPRMVVGIVALPLALAFAIASGVPPERGLSSRSWPGGQARSVHGIVAIKQLSEFLTVSEKTIYRMLEKRRLPAIRIGGQWRFRKQHIAAWFDNPKEVVRVIDDAEARLTAAVT
jgi:excisionase family DNA binding protein